MQVNYDIALSGGGTTNIVYPTLFDSGASKASFQYPTPPTWATLDSNNKILNVINPSLTTNQSTLYISFTVSVEYVQSDADKVNFGNKIFADYIMFYDQNDGIIGLQSST